MDRPSLGDALGSIALQTHPQIEVIVVNACGGNHSPLGPSCGQHRLTLVNADGPALRRSAAANAGLATASGEFFGFLDDDDLLTPDHVTHLVNVLCETTDAVAAYARTKAVDGAGATLREFGMSFDATALYLNNYLPIHSVLFRRQAYDGGARFDESFDLCEDWDFWIQVAQHGRFVFADRTTAIYRIAGDGGFALTGDPARARAAEEAICAKWRGRMSTEAYYDIVVRARTAAALPALQARADSNEFQVKDLRRMQSELLAAHEQLQHTLTDTIARYESSRSWRITRPLRRAGCLARQVRRAWRGLCHLGGLDRLRILVWLATGRISRARRQLSIAAQQAEAVTASADGPVRTPVITTAAVYLEPPTFSPLPGTVDVLIPIYNGFEYLGPLFDSLAAADSTPYRLLVCDDASPDEHVRPWLEERMRSLPHARLFHNPTNLGFIGTVNRLAELAEHDFVLLNSDVQVPPFWLERLFAPMLADPQIASVTPFTNAGTICSFPHFFQDNSLPTGLDTVGTDAAFARLVDVPPIEIPTGVGFCMAVRRVVAQRIGMFDTTFGKGYREENDWCERARLAGYRHVLVPNLFVHHKHCGSFSSAEKQALSDRNEGILRQRYPDIFARYQDFIDRDPVRPLRDFLRLMVAARQAATAPQIIIDNVIEGGAYAYSREQIDNHLAAGRPVLHLLDDFRRGELRAEWLAPGDGERLSLGVADYADWGRIIAAVNGKDVLINNIYSFHQPRHFLDWLASDPHLSAVDIRLALHDFFMLCPSLFLIDADRRYCYLPDTTTCGRCFERLHIDFPVGAQTIPEWRGSWDKALARMTSIVAFSHSTRDLFARIYPQHAAKVTVKPHAMDRFHHRPVRVDMRQPLHIGVVGSIAWHKGWNVLKQLCDEIERRQLPYRITVIGTLVPEFSSPCLTATGRYDRAQLPALIERSGANLFFFPSIWPETFSYVAHEIMACGVPLCCFDLGAPAEAVRHHTAGLTLDPQAGSGAWLDAMDAFRAKLAETSPPD